MADKVGGVIDRKFDSIFVLHECKILLNIIAEGEDIRMFSTNGHKFFAVEIPNFIVVVLDRG